MRLFYSIICCFLFVLDVSAQQILPGTWSFRTGPDETVTGSAGVTGYHDMTSWNSDPFQQFRYHGEQNNPDHDNFRMNFRLLFPNGYDQGESQQYPMIVFLHGLGESAVRGSEERFPPYNPATDKRYLNNDHSLYNSGKALLNAVDRSPSHPRAFPGFVFVPQNNEEWDNNSLNIVLTILDQLINEYKIDPNRIYLTGLSNGGSGVWNLLEKRPDLFAAALPISWVKRNLNVPEVVHVPIWHFQGEVDTYPLAAWARELQQKLRDAGGTPRYTEYANAGHGIWDIALSEPEFFSWMLGKNKTDIHAYYGNTEICTGDPINVKLGLSAGFNAYQWRKVIDGEETIYPTGTNHEITATEYGDYYVRISRVTNPAEADWTAWSKPLEIKENELTATPSISASGSSSLPSLDNKTSVSLTVSEGSASYQWYRNGVELQGDSFDGHNISVNDGGTYTVYAADADKCRSLESGEVSVTLNGPDDVIVIPENLSARAVSETAINLAWNDRADNELGYEIYRSTSQGANYTFLTSTAINQTSYKDSQLESNTTYYYIIRGINSVGSSQASNEASATTNGDTEAPSAPGQLVETGSTDNSISLAWTPSTDNVGVYAYDIYNDGALVGTTDTTSFTVEGLIKETVYDFMVVARDMAGNESESSNQLMAGAIFEGLSYKYYYGGLWTKVADYDGWNVEKSGFINNFNISHMNEGGVRPDPQVNYFAFDFEGFLFIETAGLYEFKLRAASGSILYLDGNIMVNNDGNHGDSTASSTPIYFEAGAHSIKIRYYDRVEEEILEVYYKGPDTGNNLVLIPDEALKSGVLVFSEAPVAPTNLVAEGVSSSQINLSWQDNAENETSFELYRATAPAGEFVLIATTPANAISYEDTELVANTTYYYQVKAVNDFASSDYTEASAKTFANEGAPAAPTNLVAESISFSQINLSWEDHAENETSFELYRATAPAGEFIQVATTPANAVSYEDKELAANTTYYYQVKAVNNSGSSGFAEASAKTLADGEAPAIPQNLVVQSITKNSVSLSWDRSTDNVGVVEYIIYSIKPNATENDGVGIEVEVVGSAIETYFTATDLEAGMVYSFSVSAKDAAGNISDRSNSITLTTNADTAIPTTFLYFYGSFIDNSVRLNWATAGGIANFIVERSIDDVNYGEIGTVEGVINGTDSNTYQFLDIAPRNSLNYYRVKHIESGGQDNYSTTIILDGQFTGATLSAQLYPVPANGKNLNLKIQPVDEDDIIHIMVYDSYGKLYLMDSLDPHELRSPYNIFTRKTYGKGLYIVVIEQGGHKIQKKFIVN